MSEKSLTFYKEVSPYANNYSEFAEARGTTTKEEIERLKARGFDINRITDYNKGALKWT